MQLTKLFYYVPYNFPRWGACMRPYRQTRLHREPTCILRRMRIIRQWQKEQLRMGKHRTNWFKENRRTRLNFSGSSKYKKWY